MSTKKAKKIICCQRLLRSYEYDSQLIAYADKIVKKIQTEGKWNSVREQVGKFKKAIKDKNTAEIFIDDVQHGYDRELGPILIGHCFWERLNFSTYISHQRNETLLI